MYLLNQLQLENHLYLLNHPPKKQKEKNKKKKAKYKPKQGNNKLKVQATQRQFQSTYLFA